jgi:hypothetical protein
MAFVKGFDINGINTTQTACIELQGRPNAATEGAVGLLGIDVTSPTKDVYKCVAVNGAVYTWELLSTGMSILASNNTTSGTSKKVYFPHEEVQTPDNYVVKVGDLIIDATGYIYRVIGIERAHYLTEYTGVHVNRDGVGINSVEQKDISDENGYNIATRVTIKLTNGNTYSFDVKNAYQLAVAKGYKGTEEEWLDNIGYDSWLKGMAVTQETYDALPEEEKNKPGYMYVIKDAKTAVDSLSLTTQYTYEVESNDLTFLDVDNTPMGKWCLIRFKPITYDNSPISYYTGVIYVPRESNETGYAYIGGDDTYYCTISYEGTHYNQWMMRVMKIVDGTSSAVNGTVTLIPIG